MPSCIVCGFYTAIEQSVTGRSQPRVHARPEDIELRRPAAAAAAHGDLRTRILHVIEVLQPQLSDEHSELLNRFA